MKKAATEVKEQTPSEMEKHKFIGSGYAEGSRPSEIQMSFLDKLKEDIIQNSPNGAWAIMINKCEEDGCEWIFVDESKGLDGKCDCENQGVVDRIRSWWDDLWN